MLCKICNNKIVQSPRGTNKKFCYDCKDDKKVAYERERRDKLRDIRNSFNKEVAKKRCGKG